MRQNNVYCFAFYLKTVSTVFPQFKNPHVGTYRTCWSFLFFFKKLSRHSFAKILQIKENRDSGKGCVWWPLYRTFSCIILVIMQNYCLFCDVGREAFQQVSPVLTSGMKAVPSQDRERGRREWVTLVILTCPQLSFPVPCWSPQHHHPFFSPPIFPLLPSFPRFLPSCSRLSHHVGPGEDDSVCFHCLPQLNLGFFFCFLYESRF